VTEFEATDVFRGGDLIAEPYEYFDGSVRSARSTRRHTT
jgi:hypothetical protein